MNLVGKDLNLLLLFHMLYQERSVSGAATRLALSQPALSHKLAKLREAFGDALFVRAPRGLTPTPRAHELAPHVQRLVAGIDGFFEFCEGSDFLSRDDRVHLFTTDYMEQLLLPRLLEVTRREAPNLQLVTHNTRGRLPRSELETGECDIAIAGFYEDLPGSYFQQRIHEEGFVVLAARDHPRIGERLDLATYLAGEHLVTTLTGDLDGRVDKRLREQGQARRIVAGLSSFTVPPLLVAQSDLLLTCLRSVAEQAVRSHPGLVIHECPLSLGRVAVIQAWHQRTHDDRLRAWLRARIQALLASDGE
ncbi:LysR family transcriptional regulator [Halomonas nitroreducens]|uniref:LysR family transcriptional regulator n=1 Tax=Halomonas nitroreducens TaxID=447425 RepID=A0A3S0KT90_9GAMM|nr:LysR family transcriptional regulator [Halomonas nitroreducens]RTR06487.1 LysR family transcriptional regulator [Halomonas nitroreducens]